MSAGKLQLFVVVFMDGTEMQQKQQTKGVTTPQYAACVSSWLTVAASALATAVIMSCAATQQQGCQKGAAWAIACFDLLGYSSSWVCCSCNISRTHSAAAMVGQHPRLAPVSS